MEITPKTNNEVKVFPYAKKNISTKTPPPGQSAWFQSADGNQRRAARVESAPDARAEGTGRNPNPPQTY